MEQVWFQQDNAPGYFALNVQEFLSEEFTRQCINCGSATFPLPLAWPPFSPNFDYTY
jgi:hypothetical protein